MVRSRSLAGAAVLAVLLIPGDAWADSAPKITAGPAIEGTAQVGQTLIATATVTGDPAPAATWTWLRCERPSGRCVASVSGASPTYLVDPRDAGLILRVRLRVVSPAGSDEARSAATAAVSPAPAPAPEPSPTPASMPTPTPVASPPAFDVSAAPPPTTPVRRAPSPPALLRPFPVVRIKGLLTAKGAHVTLFSVRAPHGARIAVVCRGAGCPRHRYRPPPGTRRLRPFERDLPAGTRLEVTVMRPGYVGKFTVIVIRRHAAPWRSDRCLVPGAKRPERCLGA